jgi:hypothetical protein
MDIDRIREVFAEHFQPWGVTLPLRAAETREAGAIHHRGWNIRFFFGSDDAGEYLEYYATHRMTNDRHIRIRENGDVAPLRAIPQFYVFDSETPGGEERARKEYLEETTAIKAELEEVGLWPHDDLNDFLRTHPEVEGHQE